MTFLFPFLLVGGALYLGVRSVQASSPKQLHDPSSPDDKPAVPLLEEGAVEQEERALRTQEIETQRLIKASAIAMGFGVAGAFFPPLSLLSLPLLIYALRPFYRDGLNDLFKEQRISATVVDLIFFTGTILTGYFFVAALLAWLLHLGRGVLIQTEEKSLESMVNIFAEQPRSVWIQRGGVEVETPIEAVQVGDQVMLRAGEIIPVDGTIVDGVASIDQRLLTGEARSADKGVGDAVFASTIIMTGRIVVRVDKAGSETVIAQIGDILRQTADLRQVFQSRGQQIADRAAPVTIAAGVATWPLYGSGAALAILKSSIGYNMRVIAPISALNYLRLSTRQGILIKDGRALETLSRIDTVVFDKTGTLTLEELSVEAVHTYNGVAEDALLRDAAAAETKQIHPIARAIRQEASARGLDLPEIEDGSYEIGYGIKVTLSNRVIRVGSSRFMEMEAIELSPDVHAIEAQVYEQGHSLVYVAIDDHLAGVIELRTTLRPEVRRVISELRRHHMSIHIISGDHEQPTHNLARELEIDDYVAEILPEQKGNVIAQLQAQGRTVAFVGDGINDAIALRQADVSVSLRGASTVATDVAQIILLGEDLHQLGHLFNIATDFEVNMQRNLDLSVIPSLICIGGVLFFRVGIIGGVVLYSLGLVAGLLNATSPLRHTVSDMKSAASH